MEYGRTDGNGGRRNFFEIAAVKREFVGDIMSDTEGSTSGTRSGARRLGTVARRAGGATSDTEGGKHERNSEWGAASGYGGAACGRQRGVRADLE